VDKDMFGFCEKKIEERGDDEKLTEKYYKEKRRKTSIGEVHY